MKTLSSYQRLKQKNAELQGIIAKKNTEIYVLIREPESYLAELIKMGYELGYRLDDEIWSGSADKTSTGGLWKQITDSG